MMKKAILGRRFYGNISEEKKECRLSMLYVNVMIEELLFRKFENLCRLREHNLFLEMELFLLYKKHYDFLLVYVYDMALPRIKLIKLSLPGKSMYLVWVKLCVMKH